MPARSTAPAADDAGHRHRHPRPRRWSCEDQRGHRQAAAAVTLAFTPYGADPTKLVERARSQGHEVLLQIPMEPFDYPDNDPGPQTLLTSASSRISTACTGISAASRAMPASPTSWARALSSTDAAMQPVIREAAKRGLAFLDDGSAPRSLAGQVAQSQAMPFAKADLAIDTVPTAAESTARLHSSRPSRASAGWPWASRRRCRSRSTASPRGSRFSRAAVSCLCR